MFTITNKRHASCCIIILIVGFPPNRVLEKRISSTGANIPFLFSPTSNASAVAYTSFQECAFSLSDIALIS